MRFCSNCGNRLEDGAAFCPNCGKVFAEQAAEEAKEAVAEAAPEVTEKIEETAEEVAAAAAQVTENVEKAAEELPPVAPSEPVVPVTPPPVITNEPAPEPVEDEKAKAKANKPLSVGMFILFDILLAIPVINFVMTLVLSFAPKNKNVRHFWQAKLVWVIVGVVLLLVAGIFAIIFQDQIAGFIQQIYDTLKDSGLTLNSIG